LKSRRFLEVRLAVVVVAKFGVGRRTLAVFRSEWKIASMANLPVEKK
jgi:hypothetical protein